MKLGRTLFLFFSVFAFLLSFAATAHASFEQGKKAYDRKDWRQAIYYLRPLAETGDDRAMVVLGNMYGQGYGVEQNYREAFTLYLRAAGLHNVEAMAAVGALYQQGKGTQKSPRLARGWYERAARSGHRAAMVLYAIHLYEGNKSDDPLQDMSPDHSEAYFWLTLAASRAEEGKSQKALRDMANKVAEKMSKEEIVAADARVPRWKPVPVGELGPYPEQNLMDEEKALKEKRDDQAPVTPSEPSPHE